MQKSKGFTIIELLVVVAIIAVLTGIVLVNVTQYINKGKDAAIQGNLRTIQNNATVFYSDSSLGNGDYTADGGFTSSQLYLAPLAAILSSGGIIGSVKTTTSSWCVVSSLNAGGYWCVDSTGFAGKITFLGSPSSPCEPIGRGPGVLPLRLCQ